jgi:ankyrin repeat protein
MRANTGSMGVWSIVVPSTSPAAAEGGRPLVDAVLRALLKKSVDVNAADPDGPTALHRAGSRGPDLGQALLAHGANPNAMLGANQRGEQTWSDSDGNRRHHSRRKRDYQQPDQHVRSAAETGGPLERT